MLRGELRFLVCATFCSLVCTAVWGGRPDHNFFVGAYYYPWHFPDFHGHQYLREHLSPPQLPELGEYNDRDPAVIAQHLAWSRQAGVDFWVASWWGPDTREDVTLRTVIFPHSGLGDFKIAVFYETVGRTNDFTDYSHVDADIAHIATTYFNHPNYLRINDRPVLFVYVTRVLTQLGTLQNTIATMRNTASAAGHNVYIVGDEVFGGPPGGPGNMALLDAVTNYDVYGNTGSTGYAGQVRVDSYYAAQASWRTLAHSVGTAFVPAVSPGFNDRAVRSGHEPLSRQLTADSEFGSLFRSMLDGAKPLADAELSYMLMVTSWNEWHEDTQIEPVRSAPATSQDDSGTQAFTSGLAYEGYGNRYLDILTEETIPLPRTPDMFDAQWAALIDERGFSDDLDTDGLPERWALRLVGAVLTNPAYPYAVELEEAYLANLEQLDTQESTVAPYRKTLAALLLMSQAVRDFVIVEFGLTGTYAVVSIGPKPSNEPFSGEGDLDGDQFSNAEEYAGMISWGGSIDQFPDFALNPLWSGQESLPVGDHWGLAALLLIFALAPWILRPKKRERGAAGGRCNGSTTWGCR